MSGRSDSGSSDLTYSRRLTPLGRIHRLGRAAILFALPFIVCASHARMEPPKSAIDILGRRKDKNAAGHGKNVAMYAGSPSRFFYATHEMGEVFSPVSGRVVEWNPDHIVLKPESAGLMEETRRVFVTREDVIVVEIELRNPSSEQVEVVVPASGDCRGSRDWRAEPVGEKRTLLEPGRILLTDRGVFPEALPSGLTIAVAGSLQPINMRAPAQGAYRMEFPIRIPARSTRRFRLACALDPDTELARRNLATALKSRNPLAANRKNWLHFFEREVPRFTCSDPSIEELYAFRWWLLKFSTAGGDLGYFKYPVVMEGRQAFQTYCCYSAPFMAQDLNWAADKNVGFGHIAGMAEAAYDDGRFPWYVSPRTNRVPIHHRSGTGLSLLPETAWKHYVIHGDKELLRRVYPAMRKNMEWWIRDRDSDGNGLFLIDHQLESGMDDLFRWGESNAELRYEAIDATSYAYTNLLAVSQMAKVLGETADFDRFASYADRVQKSVNSLLWDEKSQAWLDRRPDTGELAAFGAIGTLNTYLACSVGAQQMDIFRRHLLNPNEFWLPYPVPALAKNHPRFRAEGYWEGPSWPAATSHVVEAFASAAKLHDRKLLPQAAELFRRAMKNHLQLRPDFFERYNAFTGKPLSTFRDYMHSWWIDLLIRHGAGFNPQPDGSLVIDPLPMGWTHFALRGVPHRGEKIDIVWDQRSGLTVRSGKKTLHRAPDYVPGSRSIHIPAQ